MINSAGYSKHSRHQHFYLSSNTAWDIQAQSWYVFPNFAIFTLFFYVFQLFFGRFWANWVQFFRADSWRESSSKNVNSFDIALLPAKIFKVKVGSFFPTSAHISWRDINYKCFWKGLSYFRPFQSIFGPKNPPCRHLEL